MKRSQKLERTLNLGMASASLLIVLISVVTHVLGSI